MKIGILGTGIVGQSIASRSAELGHNVMIGTRDVAVARAYTEPDGMGSPGFAHWLAAHSDVQLGTQPEAAAHAELVVNATSGAVSLSALTNAGANNLADKPLLDVANPLDFAAGMPPTLLVKDTDSLAEQIQRAFPSSRVVKSLNTMSAAVMTDPRALADANHSVFVSGNNSDAKAVVVDLLKQFGWTDILDLGDLSSARGTEMLLPLWLRLWGTLGTGSFNVNIAR